MEQYVVKGGVPLRGKVSIGGAKNAALGILAAAIMTDETILIENLPDVRDINVLLEAIAGIGAQVDRINKSTVKINGSTIGDVRIASAAFFAPAISTSPTKGFPPFITYCSINTPL